MKQLARYKINFDSSWLIASTVLMGLAFFCHAMHFFVLSRPQDMGQSDKIFFLIIPMILEVVWVVLLRCIKLNAAGIHGILGILFSLLMVIQACFVGGAWYIVLSIFGYLIACGGWFFILGGFFPYKYIGMAWVGMLFLVRLIRSGLIDLLRQRDWAAVTQVLPGLCILCGLTLFYGGITGVRNKH